MYDNITHIGDSVIQHGKYNDRIYLIKLSTGDFPAIIDELDQMAKYYNYSKIFAKVPQYAEDAFIANGFIVEALIPNFYNDSQAFFMSKYFNKQRSKNYKTEKTNKILEEARKRATEKSNVIELGTGFVHRICGIPDAPMMAEVYKRVFATYPFPIYDPSYIKSTMEDNVVYFGIWYHSKIIALSSAEIDIASGNAEMTDFATLPKYIGKGFSLYLLQLMESELKMNINTAYSIARALSFGMNITLAKMGYIYSGTLVNNSNISGHLESMNVWYKFL